MNIEEYDIIISSYNNVSKNINILSNYEYFFLVLDEGHLIKNPKTKLS